MVFVGQAMPKEDAGCQSVCNYVTDWKLEKQHPLGAPGAAADLPSLLEHCSTYQNVQPHLQLLKAPL